MPYIYCLSSVFRSYEIKMEFHFGIVLIISFSSVLLTSPLAFCHPAPAPSLIPVSYISEAPAYIRDAPAPSPIPVSYISEAPAYIRDSPAPSPIPVSHISEAPTYIPGAPTTYISDVPVSAPKPSLAPDSSPVPISSSFPAPSPLSTVQFSVDKTSNALDPIDLKVIKKICDVTENPELCANSILPYMKTDINPLSALKTEITTFLNLTEKALAQLKASADNPSTSSSTADCLKVCLEIYSSAQADLKQALDAIASNDMGLLKSVLSGAITDLGTCDDTFAESAGDELPLDNDLVATMHKLADNCMDISAVLLV